MLPSVNVRAAERATVLALSATLAAAGCITRAPATPPPTPTAIPAATASPSPSPIPVAGRLGEALAYVPPVTSSVSFTDWVTLKAGVGAAKVTGASSFGAKADVLETESTLAGYGLRFIGAHRDDWGFDAMDLEWDLLIIPVSGAPIWVLRFPKGFDLRPIERHMDQRGFGSVALPGGRLRAHALDPDASWTASTELGILNTAFLADGQTLVLSPSQAPVREMLAAGPVDGMGTTARRVANLLGSPAAATMLIGTDTCADIAAGLPPSPADLRATIDKELGAAGPLHAYDALAIGYTRAAPVIGRIVIGYDDPATEAADFSGRTTLVRSGTSTRSGKSYGDTIFTLAKARQEAGSMVFEVTPRDDQPARLFDLVIDRDMLFALCTAKP